MSDLKGLLMRKMILMAAFLLVLLPMLSAGCSSSPARATLDARDTYTATLNVLTALVEADVIDAETAEEIEVVRRDAADALDAMEEAAVENDRVGWEFAHDAFSRAVDKLLAYRIQAERAQRDDG